MRKKEPTMKLEHSIEALIRAKRFEELSQAEQSLVLQRITREEYKRFRVIICGSHHGRMNTPTHPSPLIKKNLMAAMRQKRQQPRPIATFMQKVADSRVPVWQAAAAVAALLFVVFWGSTPQQPLAEAVTATANAPQAIFVDTVYETVFDTVYKEVPSHKLSVSPSGRYSSRVTKVPSRKVQNTTPAYLNTEFMEDRLKEFLEEAPLLADTTLPRKLKDIDAPEHRLWNEKSIGRSMRDDIELMNIFAEELN